MHTAEPWEFKIYPGNVREIFGYGQAQPVIPWAGFEESFIPDAVHDSNGERIVACVNAMAGVSDPAAFVAKVRELISYFGEGTRGIHWSGNQVSADHIARELAAMLPPEPKE